jgi:hypothetical protein
MAEVARLGTAGSSACGEVRAPSGDRRATSADTTDRSTPPAAETHPTDFPADALPRLIGGALSRVALTEGKRVARTALRHGGGDDPSGDGLDLTRSHQHQFHEHPLVTWWRWSHGLAVGASTCR